MGFSGPVFSLRPPLVVISLTRATASGRQPEAFTSVVPVHKTVDTDWCTAGRAWEGAPAAHLPSCSTASTCALDALNRPNAPETHHQHTPRRRPAPPNQPPTASTCALDAELGSERPPLTSNAHLVDANVRPGPGHIQNLTAPEPEPEPEPNPEPLVPAALAQTRHPQTTLHQQIQPISTRDAARPTSPGRKHPDSAPPEGAPSASSGR